MYFTALIRLLSCLLFVILKILSKVMSVRKQRYKFKPLRFEEIKPRDKNVPFPRSGHRIGANSANFYSFGGFNPLANADEFVQDEIWVHSFPLFQELWRFNFATKVWSRYPNFHTLPMELASNALTLQKNLLMVFGGTGAPFADHCSNQLYICNVNDPKAYMTEVAATGQLPQPLYGQALVYHNGYLYTIGGTTGFTFNCDIHRLNMKTLCWEEVCICKGGSYQPEGRYRHEVAFDGKDIYILGGGTESSVFDLHHLPVFNIEEKQWRVQEALPDAKKGFPPPRRNHGAVQITTDSGVQAFICGGYDGQRFLKDLWRLDLRTLQWACFAKCNLPRGLHFHAAAASPEGRLYVFGGIYKEREDCIRSNAIYSTWLCVPKLSEMCWEALLQFSPHLVDLPYENLVNLGIPRHFLNRIEK